MPSSPSKPQTLTLTTSSLFPTPTPTPLPPLPSHIPPSHLIPSTRFLVDAFRFCGAFSRSYFLSHFHSDHYSGLTSSWRKGIIFCSLTTSKLLVQVLKLPATLVFPLPLDETVGIDGCEVTVVDANHCPGAVVFLFRVPVGVGEGFRRYVHTGDFRFCESMRENEFVRRFIRADAVFLDTTYCHPKFNFPPQDESVDYVARTVERVLAERKGLKEKVLVLIATYVIGKERILVEVSRRCGCLVHVDGRKMEVLRVLGYGDSGIFTEDASLTDVHVVGWNVLGETWPYFRPNFVKMGEIMRERGYTKAVGFVPTGWMYEMKKDGFAVRAKDLLEIHLVPYSEHSSYNELREFVGFLRPMRVIPTVGLDVDKLDSKHALSMQKHFASLVDETANKHQFLAAFRRAARDSGEKAQSDMDLESDKDANVQGDDDENKNVSPDKETHHNNERSDMDLESDHGGNVQGDEDENRDSTPDKETLHNIVDKLNTDLEGAIYELSKSLPSWTTKEQMVDLLTRSTGDVVEAVSEFYEHETELFEQANASTSTSQMDSMSKVVPCAIFPNACIDLNNNAKSISIRKGMTNKDIAISKNMSPKKRGQPLGSRSKKKGKKSASKLDGSKQVTITKFFNKSPSETSKEVSFGSCTTEKQLVEKLHHPSDPPEPCEDKMDQFLRIINFDIPRNNAISLLEKAKGNLNAALDLYYSVRSSDTLEKDLSINCNSEVHSQGSLVTKFTKGIAKSSKAGDTVILATQTERNKDQSAAFLLLPLEKYSPAQHACWEAGEPAPYLHLAHTFDLVEQEKGKIKTTNILCNMFRSLLALSPEDVLPAVYLCTNKIAPDHENMELNIGFGMVTAALEETCGTSRSKLRDMYNDLGDLGDVALICRQTQGLLVPPHPLSIKTLFSSFRKISVETGAGSATRKKSIIISLLRSCREKEIKFVVRTLVRNLRIGAMLRTVLPSLAQAVVLRQSLPERHEENVDRLKTKLQEVSTAVVEAYNIVPNLDLLIPALLNTNIGFSSSSLALVPGMPIPPMLARITNGIPQVLKSFNGRAFTCEFKYDGQRAQIHRQMDGTVRVFSRNMGETTSKFPDLVEVIQDLCKHVGVDKTFILDSEVVAVDRKNNNKLMAFQHLSSRERGGKNYSVRLDNLRVDICIFVFDMMFYNGKQLLGFPLRQRRKFLKDLILEEKPGYLEFAKEMTVEADEAIEGDHNGLAKLHSFLEDSCNSSCEGIMVKSLDVDANYAASKRTESWLKVKRDYVEGLGDSLDLVPIGAWYGNGRKAKWYSPFLMACYNHDNEEFQSVCRVMSGFSDSFYAEMKEFFSGDKVLSKKPPYYQTDEKPDLWFSSELVWEIRGAEFSISPVHYASIGMVHPSRGISIRFPRYVRTVSDKRPEDCTTATEIADMYRSQSRKMGVDIPE